MELKTTIFTNWEEVKTTITDYCKEAYYIEYFQKEVPTELNKEEYLIIEGEGDFMVPQMRKIIKDLDIKEKPHDYETNLLIKFCVIYPKFEDSN